MWGYGMCQVCECKKIHLSLFCVNLQYDMFEYTGKNIKRGTWMKGCYKNTELQIVKIFNGGVRGYGVYLSWGFLKGWFNQKMPPKYMTKSGKCT